MTPRETAAYHAGIETMRQMALVAAVTIETRPDADGVRQRAAAAALQGLAEGARALLPARHDPVADLVGAIAADPNQSGKAACPHCAGGLRWVKGSTNGHIHAECETAGCLRLMQ